MMKFFDRFYLDKEKDIIVNLYKENEDEEIFTICYGWIANPSDVGLYRRGSV